MSTVKVPKETCWSAEYLLAHCEGYRVESAEGTLGYVAEVLQDPRWGVWGDPVALRVHTDDDVLRVPIDDVLELSPNEQRLVVRRQNG